MNVPFKNEGLGGKGLLLWVLDSFFLFRNWTSPSLASLSSSVLGSTSAL